MLHGLDLSAYITQRSFDNAADFIPSRALDASKLTYIRYLDIMGRLTVKGGVSRGFAKGRTDGRL